MTKSERNARILELWDNGTNMSMRQIGDDVGVSRSTVAGVIHRAETEKPPLDRGEKLINKLTLLVPDSLLARVKERAVSAGRPIAVEVRHALEAYYGGPASSERLIAPS